MILIYPVDPVREVRPKGANFIFCNISIIRVNLPDLSSRKDLGEDLIKWNGLKNNLSFRGVSWHAFCYS
jgi:hypothetical protein